MKPEVTVTRIREFGNLLVIKKSEESNFFRLADDDTIIITTPNLATLINFLVKYKYMSHKVLEGILEEVKELENGR